MSNIEEELSNLNLTPIFIVLFMVILGGFCCCKAVRVCHNDESIPNQKYLNDSKQKKF